MAQIGAASAVPAVALGLGAEFALIGRLRRRWGPLAPGLGDDAAVLAVPRGEHLVASTDVSLEGVHFRRSWLTPREVASRAVTAALSDLAAMGAAPLGILVSLQLPRAARRHLTRLADGVADAVRAAGTVILGGNISRAAILAVTTTVLGSARAPLRRSGARPGDLLYVTGSLGGPAAAVRALVARRRPRPAWRSRFAHPVARIVEARWLAARGVVAAIDVSDGLLGDAAHLAAASGVGVEIHANRVPRVAGVSERDALSGGEEYELLVAVRAPLPESGFHERFGIPLTAVGRVIEGPPGVRVTGARSRMTARRGYDHFSR